MNQQFKDFSKDKCNKPFHIFGTAGIKIKCSKKKMKCKLKGCKTMLNKYRIENGSVYCTIHERKHAKKNLLG